MHGLKIRLIWKKPVIYSQKHNCLIYPKGNPYLQDIKGSREINGSHIAIPYSLENCQQIRRVGLRTPAPLEISGYNYPIRPPWTALAHQKVTANFLALNPHAFCFNDMGTMKTLSALWAADFLMGQSNEPFRCLVIAPLSILRSVWAKHIFDHFAGKRTYRILHGDHDKRRRELNVPADFYIINHDGLGCGVPTDPRAKLYGLAADLVQRTDIKLAIIDEAGAYREQGTRRSRAARSIIGARPYLWLLTGTPTPNGPLDAYGLAKLAGTTNGESFRSFQGRTMIHVSQWKWVPRVSAPESVHRLLSPSIRFSADMLKLPPCTTEQRNIPFSKEQEYAWKKLKKEAVLALQSGALVHAVNEAALRLKLIQVAAGVVYDREHTSHDLNPSARLGEVSSIIQETDRKIVIFAPLTSVLNLLYEKLCAHRGSSNQPPDGKALPRQNVVILNGNVPAKDRVEILRAFGNPNSDLRICLADPSCTSHGINEFVSAGVCVWYAPTDKNDLYRQGVKRLDRPGQTGPVKIIQLVSTQLEKDIYNRLDANESLQGLILKFAEGKEGK